MSSYWYIAKDENGNKLSGTYSDVTSVAQLRVELTKIGYSLVRARKEKQIKQRATRPQPRFFVQFSGRAHLSRQLELFEFVVGMQPSGFVKFELVDMTTRQLKVMVFLLFASAVQQ